MDIKVKGRKYRVKPRKKSAAIEKSSFWEDKTIEQLAKEQGVKPITDVRQLAGDWPEDADFESFLRAVRSARED